MVTLYHLNHGCKDCTTGYIFDLLPIKIADGAEHAEAYEEWRRAFPSGLSVFGYRHMTPEQPFGEVPQPKLRLEWECEKVRLKYFPHILSRYQAFFGVATLKEALAFRQATLMESGLTGSIWEVEAESISHRGDMRLLTYTNYSQANLLAYWEGKALDGGEPIWECMIKPPVTMIKCVVQDDTTVA
ncbi:hypothetical protein [Schlesneria sp. T3-172]|uniref:hypothetical protein n=1 Tax=Schlesneria sphaerica TaxID=3373610 RepID=UPI0037CCB89F